MQSAAPSKTISKNKLVCWCRICILLLAFPCNNWTLLLRVMNFMCYFMHVLFQLFSTITILTPNVIAIIHLRNAATESEFNILNERYLQALVERPLITVILRYIYIYIYIFPFRNKHRPPVINSNHQSPKN